LEASLGPARPRRTGALPLLQSRNERARLAYRGPRRTQLMTYCIGVLLNDGVVLASDSRTHAGVDNFATFCKMTVFERPGDRVLVLLSSGNLAGTQAVVSILKQRGESPDTALNIWSARTMFDVAVVVSDAMRDVERRDAKHLEN